MTGWTVKPRVFMVAAANISTFGHVIYLMVMLFVIFSLFVYDCLFPYIFEIIVI